MLEERLLSVQGTLISPLAFPGAQRYAIRDELDSDSEDTAGVTPNKSSQAMPTVDEDLSPELPPESYEELRKAEGIIYGLWPHCM